MSRREQGNGETVSRFYRMLLSLLPRHIRRRHGRDMQEMFEDIVAHEGADGGRVGRSRLAVDATRDLLGSAVADRLPAWDMLRQDVGYALRRLRLQPRLSIVAVTTLALGIGAVTTVFSFVNALLLEPFPYPDVDRVVAIGETTPQRPLNGEGWLRAEQLERLRDVDALDSVAALNPFFVTLTGSGDPEEVIGWQASPEFFEVIGVAPVVGRVYTDPVGDAVVLGYAFWQRRFNGDPDVIGRRLQLGSRSMQVVGVLPRGAEFPMGSDLWVPLDTSRQEDSMRVIARLAPDASLAQLRAQLAAVAAEFASGGPDTPADRRIETETLRANATINTRTGLGFLLGAAGFLLLLVCANVANMQLAQSSSRLREIAVRQALGAPRIRIVRQLLTESIALAVLAALAGTALAVWGSQVLRTALAHERWRFFFAGIDDIGISSPVLVFTAAVSLLSVVVFGLAPALRGSSVAVDAALKTAPSDTLPRSGRLRRSLVVLEVALSVVLLFGAGLMALSIGALATVDPRIDTGVFTARLRLPPNYRDDARVRGFFAEAIDRVGAVPGVGSVAFSDRAALGSGRGIAVETDSSAASSSAEVRADQTIVAGDYFDTLGISLLRGRTFQPSDPSAVVVSASLAARLWPDDDPLGRRLRFGAEQPWLEVVGVAADVPSAWNNPRPAAVAYMPHTQIPSSRMQVLVRIDGDAATTAAAIRDAIWSIDEATVIFAPETIASTLEAEAGPLRAMSRLAGGMALTALLVCLSGIYALVAHAASRRTREIGVRMALGAGRTQVQRMLVLHGIKTSGLGLAIGIVLALGLGVSLRGFMPDAAALSGRILAGLAVGVLALAGLSSWVPARRAARTDPAATLRAD